MRKTQERMFELSFFILKNFFREIKIKSAFEQTLMLGLSQDGGTKCFF
jgi:hypothetical protein